MKEKANKDSEIYKKVNLMDSDSEEIECDNETEKEVKAGKRVYISKTGLKRRRMSQEDNSFVEDYLAACDRFKVSDTSASTLFNIHNEQQDRNLKLNQSQVHKKEKV